MNRPDGGPSLETTWPPQRLRRRRVAGLVLQAEASECALACVAMVAGAHGVHIDLATLRERWPPSLRGMNLADALRVGDSLGLAGRGLRLEPDELDRLALPCILHWEFDHFVVLARVRRGGVDILDPAAGRRSISKSEVARRFTGIALELVPGPRFERVDIRQRISARELFGDVRGLAMAFATVGSIAFALELTLLGTPLLLQWVVDTAIASGDRELLATLVLGFGLLLAGQIALASARGWASFCLVALFGLQWIANLFAHLVRLPIVYFERRPAGDVINRFGGATAIQQAVTAGLVEALLDGILVLCTFTLMLVYSPLLAALSALAATVHAGLRTATAGWVRRTVGEHVQAMARQQSLLLETIHGIQSIRLGGREQERSARWRNAAIATANGATELQRTGMWVKAGSAAVFGTEHLATIWIGGLQVIDNALTVGMLVAFLAFRSQFAGRIAALADRLADLATLRVHADRLADLVRTTPEGGTADGAGEAGAPDWTFARLEVDHVVFRHGRASPAVLDGIGFALERGETLAIVGASGCGKTTLAKVVLGLLEPEAGCVRINGVDLRHFGAARFRRKVGTVMQDDTLFAGSIAENIADFDAAVGQARIERAARLAAVDAEIRAMPMGYRTRIGEGGRGLSGGQRQRVMLARALCREPELLVLDEATSHLDVEGENAVNLAVRALGITCLVIAHRPQTAAAASRVLRLAGARHCDGSGGTRR